MGKLIQGKWITDNLLQEAEKKQYKSEKGRFVRGNAGYRHWITQDGAAGPSGEGGFKAQEGRYHLFAAINCPWAHRTLIFRNIKKLQSVIGLSLVAPLRSDQGWVFDQENSRFKDSLYDLKAIHELYVRDDPEFTGRVTVPVLWDKHKQKIVSNESADIIRMMNSGFNHISGDDQDFYPNALQLEIDELNFTIFNDLNNGVYKTGFARTQQAYDESVVKVFSTLDELEKRLATNKYLLGETITEADWRLFPTLVRFDVAYFSAFKCNLKAIRDYPNLSAYLKDLYDQPRVSETVDLDIYRNGYHSVSPVRNPYGISPIGFNSDFAQNSALQAVS